jgi:hypothetical protein
MRTHTAEDLEYDLSLLWAYEGEGMNQAELAEREGMSQGHLSRRLARARRYRDELEKQKERIVEAIAAPETLPYLVLTTDPGREWRPCYDLDTDECTLESGLARIGNRNGTDAISGSGSTRRPVSPLEGQRLRVLNVNGGPMVKDPGGPTKHQPDPDGLRGGVG